MTTTKALRCNTGHWEERERRWGGGWVVLRGLVRTLIFSKSEGKPFEQNDLKQYFKNLSG